MIRQLKYHCVYENFEQQNYNYRLAINRDGFEFTIFKILHFFREIKTFVKTQIISFQKLLNAYTLIIVAWKYNIHNWYFIRNLEMLLLKRT